jgi:hypothetical protein
VTCDSCGSYEAYEEVEGFYLCCDCLQDPDHSVRQARSRTLMAVSLLLLIFFVAVAGLTYFYYLWNNT